MSGTFSILERYFPTHKFDYETKTFAPNLNFFSDLMAEQAAAEALRSTGRMV